MSFLGDAIKKVRGETSTSVRAEPLRESIRRARGGRTQVITKTPEKTGIAGLAGFFDKAPEPLKKIGSFLKEGAFGRGQEVDLSGRLHFGDGALTFLRPFGLGKTKEEKVSDRIDLTRPLVEKGIITQERADEIARSVLEPTAPRERIEAGKPIVKEKFALTDVEKRALRPVRIEETLDKVFGAIDLVSLGTLKPITRGAAERIAKSKVTNDIIDILAKELPELKEEARSVFSKILVNIDETDDVQTVLNRTELILKEAKNAGAVKNKSLSLGDAIKKARSEAGSKPVSLKTAIRTAGTQVEPTVTAKVADDLVKAADGLPVTKTGNNFEEVLKKTKTGGTKPSTVTRTLVEEAKNFNTVEEFVKKQIPEVDDFVKVRNWIAKEEKLVTTKTGKSVVGREPLKEVSLKIQKGDVPDDILEAMRETLPRQTLDRETGEIFKFGDSEYPRTGTLLDFQQSFDDVMQKNAQLTDIFNQAKKAGVKPQTQTKTVAEASAEEGFVAKKTVAEGVEVEALSGTASFDKKTAENFRHNPSKTPPYVAMRINDNGAKVPAIRESGVFAPKDFETFNFTDLKGILGKYGINIKIGERKLNLSEQSFNLRDASLSFDNVTGPQAAKEKNWGPMVEQQYETRGAEAEGLAYATKKGGHVKTLADEAGVKITDETGEELLKALEGEGTPKMLKLAGKIRDEILNPVREDANVVRKALGKKEIGFVEDYAPRLKAVHFWRDLLTSQKTDIDGNFDFITPNAKRNPHAIPRQGGLVDREKNAWKLISSYVESMSNDIFIAPQIEKLKAIDSVIARKNPKMSKFLNTFIRENLIGKSAGIDNMLGIRAGTKRRAVLNKIVMARNVGVLSGNLVFVTVVQPASTLGMTMPRAGGVTRGFQNMLGGMLDFATNKELKKQIKELPVFVSKTQGASIGMTGAGDVDRMANKIQRGKIEKFSDFVSQVTDAMEYWLTGSAIGAGYREAKALGLKGKNADIFADWMGGATQSEYNKLGRPLMLNDLTTRTLFPFSTFTFELYRFVKTLAGKQGGMPLEKSQRVSQAIMLVTGIWMYNQYSEKATGRTLTSWGAAIPLVGNAVEGQVDKVVNSMGFETKDKGSGRAPVAPAEDLINFYEGLDHFVNDNNIHPLRKELLKWSMGFAGIAGAATANRFIDGMIANTQGFQKTKGGDFAFLVEGTDKIIAPMMGPYSTSAGKAYIDEITESNNKKASMMPVYKEANKLRDQGYEEEAQSIVDGLTDNEYYAYNLITQEEEAKRIMFLKSDVFPIYKEAEKFVNAGQESKAQELVDGLTDDEYKAYNQILDDVKRREDAKNGKKPKYFRAEDQENSVYVIEGDIIKTIGVYADAIKVSPIEAFKLIFKGEKLRRLDNGTIIVKRIVSVDLDFDDTRNSEQIRKQLAKGRDLDELRLDHTVSLQLGGNNSDENLQLIPIGIWRTYTPIENHLGELLRNGKIKGDEAQRLITEFKEGRTTAVEILEMK